MARYCMRVLGCLAGLVFASAASAQVVEQVCVARSADGRSEAWLSGREGLVVHGWSPAPRGRLVLGSGAYPRFDAEGNLFFEISDDDGHQVLTSALWVVERGARVARRARPDEVVPLYRLPVAPMPPAPSAIKVCIDPGHGGSDPGALGFGLQEKDITLDVGLKLRDWFDRDSMDTSGGGTWTVLMTRTDDSFVGLTQRANMANAFGAQSFLSIHMNSFGSPNANGTETYCLVGQENAAGGRLRNFVHAEALLAWGLRDRGTKTASFTVLSATSMPASLLEGGFITSPIDVVLLGDPVARDRLALHCLFAEQQFYGLPRYQPITAQTGLLKGVVYDAAQGANVRIGNALVALADGRFTMARSTDGYFEFTLPAGTFLYGATAAGFDPAASSRTVPAGGEVWGSLGLGPALVPAFAITPAPIGGLPMTLTVQGDIGAPVVLLAAARPGLPPLPLAGYGWLWPELATFASIGVGVVPPSGTLVVTLTTPPVPGALAHCQAAVVSGGSLRLTNGGAFQIQ